MLFDVVAASCGGTAANLSVLIDTGMVEESNLCCEMKGVQVKIKDVVSALRS